MRNKDLFILRSLKFIIQEDDASHEDEGEMVIIRYYSNESEATLASTYLESRGVPNFLSNRFLNQLLPLGNTEIALHVKDFQKDKAEKILQEFEQEQDLDQGIQNPSDTLIVLDENWDKNYKVYKDPWVILLLIILMLVLLFQMVISPSTGFSLW